MVEVAKDQTRQNPFQTILLLQKEPEQSYGKDQRNHTTQTTRPVSHSRPPLIRSATAPVRSPVSGLLLKRVPFGAGGPALPDAARRMRSARIACSSDGDELRAGVTSSAGSAVAGTTGTGARIAPLLLLRTRARLGGGGAGAAESAKGAEAYGGVVSSADVDTISDLVSSSAP